MRSPLRHLLLLAAVLAALSCGGSEPERTADGRLILRYWEKWTGFEKEAMQAVVDRYNAVQDKVFVQFISTSQIDRKLLLATAGGNPPDIAGFWSHSLVSYAEKGVLRPLDDLMARDGITRGQYVRSVIDCCVYRDRTWGLPATPATVALHYNRTLFAGAGLDPDAPPANLRDFQAAADALTVVAPDGSYERMGFNPMDPGWWGPFWGYWFGGTLVSDDGRLITCDSPENIAAFSWMRGWIARGDRAKIRLFEGAHRGQFASPSNSFMSGRIAMKQQGVWMASFIKEFGAGMDWAACPFPAADNVTGGPATVVEVDILVIPRGARHVEQAWEFIRFVQEQKNMEDLCRAQGKFSPLLDVSPGFHETHPNPQIRVFRALAESPNARAVPKTPVWSEYRDELAVAISQMWLKPEDELSTADALGAVRRRMQPKLDRAWELWDEVGEQREREWSGL